MYFPSSKSNNYILFDRSFLLKDQIKFILGLGKKNKFDAGFSHLIMGGETFWYPEHSLIGQSVSRNR